MSLLRAVGLFLPVALYSAQVTAQQSVPTNSAGAGSRPASSGATGSVPASSGATGSNQPGAVQGYSRYERETIETVLGARKDQIDPSPEGKRIEAIEIVALDVLEPRDPPGRVWPALTGFFNWFHFTTKPHVIEREVLVETGQAYSQTLVDETARNLRGARQLSLVLIVPLRGETPDRVRLVVITKDVWSLRLNTNFRFAGGQLQYFLLQPSEENLLGSHQSLAGQFLLEGETYSLGASYRTPRIEDSRRGLVIDANVIFNRTTADVEGSFGSLAYGQPLYSTLAEWSWIGSLAWRKEITRRYIDGQQAAFVSPSAPKVNPLPERFLVPYRYKSDLFAASYAVTRSYGRANKNDIQGGLEISRRVFQTEDLSAYDPQTVQEFGQQVPVTDKRVYPFVSYHAYSTRLSQTLDYDTLGLQEDIPIGHEVVVELYPVLRALSSSRDFMGILASAQYTLPLLDGLITGYAQSITEIEAERLADASIEGGIHIGTPSFKIGRLLLDTRVLDRYRNYLKRQTTLGGERRLRGYPTGAFFGRDVLVANAELRTKPLELWTVQLGLAGFYDTGDAFDGWSDLRIKQSAGAGLRVVFPQLERAVLRVDLGFQLTKPIPTDTWQRGGFPGDVLVTFKQAFGEPGIPSTFGN